MTIYKLTLKRKSDGYILQQVHEIFASKKDVDMKIESLYSSDGERREFEWTAKEVEGPIYRVIYQHKGNPTDIFDFEDFTNRDEAMAFLKEIRSDGCHKKTHLQVVAES